MNIEYLENRVDDHEKRLRKIEENTMEMKYELANIVKSQSDIKSLVLETNKDLTKTIKDSVATNNQIRLIDRKELWGILALVVGGIVGYFVM